MVAALWPEIRRGWRFSGVGEGQKTRGLGGGSHARASEEADVGEPGRRQGLVAFIGVEGSSVGSGAPRGGRGRRGVWPDQRAVLSW
jgi:hypothetical protein